MSRLRVVVTPEEFSCVLKPFVTSRSWLACDEPAKVFEGKLHKGNASKYVALLTALHEHSPSLVFTRSVLPAAFKQLMVPSGMPQDSSLLQTDRGGQVLVVVRAADTEEVWKLLWRQLVVVRGELRTRTEKTAWSPMRNKKIIHHQKHPSVHGTSAGTRPAHSRRQNTRSSISYPRYTVFGSK